MASLTAKVEVVDQYTRYALEALKERGVIDPSTELLRLEIINQHLGEAACLATLLGLLELEKGIAFQALRARTMRQQVEAGSRIIP